MRVRKTISFEKEVHDKLEEERGRKPLSTYVNDEFREKFKLKKTKKK
jgi:hypothetical protein